MNKNINIYININKKYLITIITHARSGSNYLCNLIEKSFDNINSNYEIFNKQKCYINEKNINKILKEYNLENSNDLNLLVHKNPLNFLENVIKLSNEPIISHKIFSEHLDFNYINLIINKSDFLIILKRKFIDIYISKKRAIEMQKYHDNPWININTTDYKIDFDKNEYENQLNNYNDWFKKINKTIKLNNKNYVIIDYDRFFNLNIEDQINLINKELSKSIPNYLLNYIEINKNNLLQKQDKSNDYITKINNYKDFFNYFKP